MLPIRDPLDPVCDLMRALAARLFSPVAFATLVPDDAAAAVLFVEVAHGGACVGCGGTAWRPVDATHLRCPACGVVPVYRGSPFSRRRLAPRMILAAIHAVFVDTNTWTARGFSRQHELRLDTTWRLLHEVRGALPVRVPQAGAFVAEVLGGESDGNRAVVALADDPGVPARLVAVHVDLSTEPDEQLALPPAEHRRDMPLWWGRLRGWLAEIFRGVSRGYLWRYLAEFSDRHGRTRALC